MGAPSRDAQTGQGEGWLAKTSSPVEVSLIIERQLNRRHWESSIRRNTGPEVVARGRGDARSGVPNMVQFQGKKSPQRGPGPYRRQSGQDRYAPEVRRHPQYATRIATMQLSSSSERRSAVKPWGADGNSAGVFMLLLGYQFIRWRASSTFEIRNDAVSDFVPTFGYSISDGEIDSFAVGVQAANAHEAPCVIDVRKVEAAFITAIFAHEKRIILARSVQHLDRTKIYAGGRTGCCEICSHCCRQ